jgi:hypothetical protein
VIITSTHSLTVLACDHVHARVRRERLSDGSEDRSKGIDGRKIYGSCAVIASHLTTGKVHR